MNYWLIFLPNELDFQSNGVESKTINQPSTSTGQQILIEMFVYKIMPLYKMTTMLLPWQPQFNFLLQKE